MERTNAFVVKWQSGQNEDTFHGLAIHGILVDTEKKCSLSVFFYHFWFQILRLIFHLFNERVRDMMKPSHEKFFIEKNQSLFSKGEN